MYLFPIYSDLTYLQPNQSPCFLDNCPDFIKYNNAVWFDIEIKQPFEHSQFQSPTIQEYNDTEYQSDFSDYTGQTTWEPSREPSREPEPQNHVLIDDLQSSSRQPIPESSGERCTKKNKMHTKTPKKSHTCLHCTKSFSRRYDLLRHVRLHTGSKPYICPCCLKEFSRSDARRRHFQVEPGCHQGATILKLIKERTKFSL